MVRFSVVESILFSVLSIFSVLRHQIAPVRNINKLLQIFSSVIVQKQIQTRDNSFFLDSNVQSNKLKYFQAFISIN